MAGTIVFGIGVAPTPEAPETHAETPVSIALAALLVRALHFAALLAGVGGGLFLVLVPGRWSPLNDRLKPGLCVLLLTAGVSAVLPVGVNGAVLAGGPRTALASSAIWTTGVTSTAGLSAGIALGALLASATGLALAPRHAAGQGLLVFGALLGAASLAVTGHAATAPPRWLSAPLVGLHGLMAAYWLGALWPLAVALRTEPPGEAARLTRRFSTLAVGAVGVLVAAGAGLSILQIGTPDALLTTEYGQNWLRKMLVVTGLLALAAYNRLRLTPALDSGGAAAAGALRRSIRAEMIFAAAVLLLTSLFAFTPPPRALMAGDTMVRADTGADAGQATVVIKDGRSALVEVVPARPGLNRVRIRVSQPDGRPLPLSEAGLEWELPAGGAAPARRVLSVTGSGMADAEGIEMPVAGRWTLRLEVGLGDLRKTVFQTEVPVGTKDDRKESKP
ncbi:copper resistance D family protein [Azospirillum sp. TSO22-1]|uniref:copper resistance D family protein n=1 Tax=Azospirillum sp. TSO22-1 TaxID=716789 RepID=UPI000D654D97|nr:copper resistance D family protein [Azospirillum sp. TSO22-1]